MSTLDMSRWQFGITTVYHFLFVPLTIGLAPLVAIMQTAWYRTGNPAWYRATKFFGKLFLINFALGVVTGIVQEFQFGMNWSAYSRFVGDVFGAPLAIEGLAAFFVESTFLGLWIFGWSVLPKRVHLACIWMVAIAVNLSAYFILAANSFMQHPVGVTYNPVSGRAELTSIGKLLTNPTVLVTFPHTIAGAFLVAGAVVLGVSAWHLARREPASAHVDVFRRTVRVGLVAMVVAGVAVTLSGHLQAQIMTKQQPMKMAAAEALCSTERGAGISIFAIGSISAKCDEVKSITVPGLLAFLATDSTDGTVQGVNDLQAAAVARYGPGDYVPSLPFTYWSFRLMIGLGMVAVLIGLLGFWLYRRGRSPASRWWVGAVVVAAVAPFLANSFGWIFTEMGRQPWVVAPNPTGNPAVRLLTQSGVSPSVGVGSVVASLVAFTLVYGVLAVVELTLFLRYAKAGPLDEPVPGEPGGDEPGETDQTRPMAFAY
ncbi:MAG: cytochrome ubiquinol oxidase subunit I [Actinomycetes bacterium]